MSLTGKKVNEQIDQKSDNEDSPILTSQQSSLRLRQLTQVIGCNLSSKDGCAYTVTSSPLPAFVRQIPFTKGFYITLEAQNEIFFTSEIKPTSNPKWDPFDLDLFFPSNFLSQKGVVISVWLKDEELESVKIVSLGIYFSGILPIGEDFTIPQKDFLPNSLILKFCDVYYMFPQSLTPNYSFKSFLCHSTSLPLSETKPSCSTASLCRLHGLKRSKRQLEKKCEHFINILEKMGIKEDSQRIQLKRKVENLRLRISTLRNFLNTDEEKLKSLTEGTANQNSLNEDKAVELLSCYQALSRQWNMLKTQEKDKFNNSLSLLHDVTAKVKERRRHLLSHLPLIFPISPYNKEKLKFTICRIFLPDAESYEGQSPQSLSSAIGYVAQLLCNISHIVNIPLRFPINTYGSLSSIEDLTSTQLQEMSKIFQLYTRGKEKERLHFDYAVFLLNKNIAQLRWCCGLNTPDLRPTLYNLFTLLFNLYSNVSHSRALMPDTIIALPYITYENERVIETPTALLQHKTPQIKAPPCLENPLLKYEPSDLPEKGKVNKTSLRKKRLNSEADNKITLSDSNQSESDMDNKNFSELMCHKIPKNIFREHLHENELSQSLDQGLDSICRKEAEPHSSKSSLDIRNDAASSFHDLSLENVKQDDFSDQTTQILRSWHEDQPSPYCSLIASSSTEVLNSGTNKERELSSAVENNVDPGANNDLNKNNIIECSQEVTGDADDSKEGKQEIQDVDKPTGNTSVAADGAEADSDMKFIKDFEEKFLNDVAFRTAALANQNCSFKISFSRQSTQE